MHTFELYGDEQWRTPCGELVELLDENQGVITSSLEVLAKKQRKQRRPPDVVSWQQRRLWP